MSDRKDRGDRIWKLPALAVALVTFGSMIPPAGGQEQETPICLDLKQEGAEGRTGSPLFVIATLRVVEPEDSACGGPIVEDEVDHRVAFEMAGANDPDGADNPEDPDAMCRIAGGIFEARCVVAVLGETEGTESVRAWIDGDLVDRLEGADETQEPGSGCLGSTSESGAEPDCTDVIEVVWAGQPDCMPEKALPERLDRIAVQIQGADRGPGLFTIDSTGGDRHRLLPAGEGARLWLWSPDHKKLLYASGYLNGLQLWVIRADGTHKVKLTHNAVLDETPAWSPDGRRVVFSSQNFREWEESELYIANAKGTKVRALTKGPMESTEPDWSPDGTRIVFSRYDIGSNKRGGLVSVDPDGSDPKKLIGGSTIFFSPQFSPDGKRILFRKHPSRSSHATELFVMHANGTHVRRLTHTNSYVSDFEWSPDGQKVVYEIRSGGGWTEIRVINVDGSSDTQLARHFFLGLPLSPSWSPDSRFVAYQLPYDIYDPNINRRGSDVWISSSDGSCSQALTSTPDLAEFSPSWITPASTSNPSSL